MSKTNMVDTIDELLRRVSIYNELDDDLELIRKAYEYARKKHAGQKRISGEDFIMHPLNVAYILTDLRVDASGIAAALLHDVPKETDTDILEIKMEFGEEIANIVDSLVKVEKVKVGSESEAQAETNRKILVSLSNDVRVIVIKLAERLHNMRTLYVLPTDKQKKKARNTLEVLAPLASRLGIGKIKSELEDLSLRYLNPDAYYDIVEKLNLKKSERDEAVLKMVNEVSELLTEHNIRYEIKGRSKGIYSIYSKMNKGKTLDDIYDLLALRVLVETEQECYLALGLIHSKYKPVPKRFKDYIAMPKTNLYQSLHTTVFGTGDELFEIQIRTYDMNLIAEYGIASHWSYKEKGSIAATKNKMEQKLQIFRNIIEINNEAQSSEDFMNEVKNDILPMDSIFVYTPKGDILELPEGATPVDFAYKVHSELGDKVVGAIVNDRIVALDYELSNGDIVKINTNKNGKGPNKDWLNFVVTTHARNRIKNFYNKALKDDYLELGAEILEKEIRKSGYAFNDILSKENLNKVLEEYNLKDINELYMGIGSSKISAISVIRIVKPKEKEETKPVIKIIKNVNNKNDILVEGAAEIKVNMASCCNAVPGDAIMGYITRGNGISIHRMVCKNIMDTEERTVNVSWNDIKDKKYYTDIIIYADYDDKVLADVIIKASANNVTINSVSTMNDEGTKVYILNVGVVNTDILNKFMLDLEQLKHISKVERLIR